jgi:hypothetical protein
MKSKNEKTQLFSVVVLLGPRWRNIRGMVCTLSSPHPLIQRYVQTNMFVIAISHRWVGTEELLRVRGNR